MRELDCEESWSPKNWCFWTVVLEKTLESPLDWKEIKGVNPKGNQSWIFIGRLMLKLKLQYFGHLMWKADSLEKTLMLGKIEGRRRREWQRMRWLHLSSLGSNYCFRKTLKGRKGGTSLVIQWFKTPYPQCRVQEFNPWSGNYNSLKILKIPHDTFKKNKGGAGNEGSQSLSSLYPTEGDHLGWELKHLDSWICLRILAPPPPHPSPAPH